MGILRPDREIRSRPQRASRRDRDSRCESLRLTSGPSNHWGFGGPFLFPKSENFPYLQSDLSPLKTPLSDRPSELRLVCCVADSLHVTPSLFSFVVRRFERTRETWFGEREEEVRMFRDMKSRERETNEP